MLCRFAIRLLAGFLLAMPAATLCADETDILNFRVSVASTRDDNLFRVPDSGDRKPVTDTITATTFGIAFDKPVSLQRFNANVSWVDTRYRTNSQLDGGSLHYDGKWLWSLGTRLSGEISADRTVVQNSFSDIQALPTTARNQRTTENKRVAADYWWHSDWHLVGSVFQQVISNEQVIQSDSDTETNGLGLGLKYTPRSGNSITWQEKRSEGRYTKRVFSETLQLDNAYNQSGHEFLFNWRLGGKSSVNGRFEYLRRKHAHFSSRDYGGWVGQLGYEYSYSDKTTLSASYQRNISASQLTTSSFYLSDGFLLSSQWAATGHVSAAARLGWTLRRYLGEIVSVATRREERVASLGFDLSYRPQRFVEMTTGFVAERRNSNDNAFDYMDKKLLLSANVKF